MLDDNYLNNLLDIKQTDNNFIRLLVEVTQTLLNNKLPLNQN